MLNESIESTARTYAQTAGAAYTEASQYLRAIGDQGRLLGLNRIFQGIGGS